MTKISSGYSIEFIPLDSFMHNLDPRSKIIISAVFMVSVFAAHQAWELIMLSVLAAGIIILSRVHLEYYWQGIRPFVFLIIISATIQAIVTPGEQIWQLYIFTVSKNGLLTGLLLMIRLLLILLIAQFLLLTTSTLALADGLDRMLHPLSRIGFPTEELLMIVTIALRFLPLLMREAIDVKNAQIARGADFGQGSLLSRLNKQITIIVPVFNLALQRAVDLAQAMESRAYVPGEKRTRLNELVLKSKDYLVIMIVIAAALIVTYF